MGFSTSYFLNFAFGPRAPPPPREFLSRFLDREVSFQSNRVIYQVETVSAKALPHCEIAGLPSALSQVHSKLLHLTSEWPEASERPCASRRETGSHAGAFHSLTLNKPQNLSAIVP